MISEQDTLEHLRHHMPIATQTLSLSQSGKTGLIIVDAVNGFVTVGAGNLAPPRENAQISKMTNNILSCATLFGKKNLPILAFLDTHIPGKPEPPYPPHCEKGTGEENLIDSLKWLESDPNSLCMRKDCIDGFIGAIRQNGDNDIIDWVKTHQIETVIVGGICTDICVMDFVLSMLSARNHAMMKTLKAIAVYEAGCATYQLSRQEAEAVNLPSTASHPQMITHYMGLYFMAARGALIIDHIENGTDP